MSVKHAGELSVTMDRVALCLAAAGLELRAGRGVVRDREAALEALRLSWRHMRCAQANLARVIVAIEPRGPVTHGV